MNSDLKTAQQLFERHDLVSAHKLLTSIIDNDKTDIQALLLRGRIHYKMQQWGNAMNDFSQVLDIEPENQEAKTGQEMAQSILGYFTPDMFNP